MSPEELRFSRRQLLKTSALSMLALTAPRVVSTAAADDPPDIVVVVLDALRAASLPIYGHPRDTAPFLSILARQATVFKHCYTTALWTRPAITGLLTGLLPIEHGQWRFGKTLPEDMPTFPPLLAKRGYRTAYFTANTAVGERYGLEQHFDHVSDEAAVAADPGSWLTRDLELWAGAEEQRRGPLFVLAHYLPPHGPYDPPTRHLDAMMEQGYGSVDFLPPHARDVDVSLNSAVFGRIPYYQAKVSFSTDPRNYSTRYEANVHYGDALARDLWERWNALGRSRRTLFVITSDHGECMGEHGLFFAHGRLLHDSILHVPLVVHDSADPTGRVVEDTVSHVDVTATLLDWAGVSDRLGRGASLVAGVRPEHPIVSQDFAKVGESGWALTRGRWRLVYNDCPRWGTAHVLAVRSGVRGRRGLTRVPLPPPATALPEPVAIPPGVAIEALALHATQVEAGEEVPFSGRVRLDVDAAGVLEVRQRVPGREPVLVLSRECGAAAAANDGASGAPGIIALGGAVTAPDARPGEPVETIWEARFTPAAASAAEAEPSWRRLFSFPVARPQEMAPGLDLVGASVEPGVARPGESVTFRTAWRIGRPPPAGAIVAIDLVAPDGTRRPASRAGGRGRDGDGAEVAGIGSVVRLERMPERFGLRLLDAARIVVPSRAAPGLYRVVVRPAEEMRNRGAAASRAQRTGDAGPSGAGEAASWGSEVVAATLEVVASADETLARVVARELGTPSLAVLAAVAAEPADGGAGNEDVDSGAGRSPSADGSAAAGASVDAQLDVLLERFPAEGHPLYLLARRARDADTRRALLDRCLDRVPFHRAALVAASKSEKARPALERLVPALPLDYRFDERVRLYGANLRRAPEGAKGLYLSLYWEALAPVGETLEALVQARTTTGDESRNSHLRYLLGQTVRPSHTWRIGECVVDVLHLRVPDDAERVAVDLVLRPGWRYDDADKKDPIVLVARHSSGSVRTRVLVASAALADLPRSRRDLLRAKRRDPIAFRLYDLEVDPAETDDRLEAEPAVFAEMHASLLPLLEQDWTTRAEGPKADVPAATQERLRALGYAE